LNIAEFLDRNATVAPNKEALVDGDRIWTYEQYRRDADRVAEALTEIGVAHGDRVGLFMTNRAEFAIAFYGILKVGGVVTSLSGAAKQAELEHLVPDCGARVIITDPDHIAEVPARDKVPALEKLVCVGDHPEADHEFWGLLEGREGTFQTLATDAEDGAEIIYTGGTTGIPKGVLLTHSNVVSNCSTNVRLTGLTPDDRCLCFLPMYHSFAQNFIFNQSICGGASLIILPRFELEMVTAAMQRRGVTRWFAVPTIYILILAAEDTEAVDRAFAGVRYCFSAAASMPAEIARKWKERFGLDVNEGYGLTETTPSTTYNHATKHKQGSVGTPVDDVEVQVWDEEDRALPTGEVGQIVVRGPNVMKGYFNNPEATAEVMKDGWLKTGDVGYRDEEGYYFLVDRMKDMVNSAGLKIWPREVEEVLYQHLGVAECSVIGVPDPLFGESVKACVVAKPGVEVCAEDIITYCKEKLSGYKAPKTVEFLDALPKSPAGKVLKTELRKMYSQEAPKA
jgi:long-chain acyl-CoA synthetase